MDSDDEDDGVPGLVDVAWRLEPPLPTPDDGRPCHECGTVCEEGQCLDSWKTMHFLIGHEIKAWIHFVT